MAYWVPYLCRSSNIWRIRLQKLSRRNQFSLIIMPRSSMSPRAAYCMTTRGTSASKLKTSSMKSNKCCRISACSLKAEIMARNYFLSSESPSSSSSICLAFSALFPSTIALCRCLRSFAFSNFFWISSIVSPRSFSC